MVRTQIQLTEAQADRLKRRARLERVSVAELVRRSVDRMLTSEQTTDRREIRRAALEAIGALRSGLPDLAAEHDRYLAEAYSE